MNDLEAIFLLAFFVVIFLVGVWFFLKWINQKFPPKISKDNRKKYLEMGKWNFIFTYGSRVAIFMFVWMWFFTKFIMEEEFDVGISMIAWGIAGLIMGLLGWENIKRGGKKK